VWAPLCPQRFTLRACVYVTTVPFLCPLPPPPPPNKTHTHTHTHTQNTPLQCAGFLPNDPQYAALLRDTRVSIPSLFITGQSDKLIPPHRTQVCVWVGWEGGSVRGCLRAVHTS
jgi:hypothetical protein